MYLYVSIHRHMYTDYVHKCIFKKKLCWNENRPGMAGVLVE